ncbi:MAG: hypothetical protein AAGK02_00415 [Pseudomonadota bacterium]
MTDQGFMSAVRLLGNGLGGAAALLLTPKAYGASWPLIASDLLAGYGPYWIEALSVLWMGLLAVLIFSGVRTGLLLLVALFGLLLALVVLPRRRD